VFGADCATKPVPPAAIKAGTDMVRDAGTDPANPEATYHARTANEDLEAQIAKPELSKMKAEVIDRARTTAARSGAW
jgi:hypothetical protein